MALKGKKPTAIEKRLKLFLFGEAGSGKTTTAIGFPKAYLIDTERGAENDQYTSLLDKNGGAIFQTADFDELLAEVKALMTEKHDYQTLIIDPMTNIYNDILDKAAADPKVGTEFGRHYGVANKKMKHLITLLYRLDMNVVITSHARVEYGEGLVKLGMTFDCFKKMDYMFDLVLYLQKRGKERVAQITKSRIGAFPEGELIPANYDEIANRYGREIIERSAVVQELATPEQLKELNRLIELLNVPQGTIDKWLKKAESENLDEMTTNNIQKCIDHLQSQIKGSSE